MDDDNTLDIQQSVGDVDGDFNKTIEIDFSDDDGSSEMGDVEAVIDLTYNIFQYIISDGVIYTPPGKSINDYR